ncbi:M56 family metallopeptidase [Aureibaculum sp. 2210JD6-5]|uniref:M56 family metallopeptidase n=1 Tax=Aureibaculum sp. 2210JD6-5 TaxID=3103957 RepID=UPI002AAEBD2A|nr:M56 family metallopeptidase [Aureibaculum sp. 2210JD6-5]MDY7395864.1 M56 family metallopeptidase [Aureibaculum sp. 2210JD6-5]
MLDYIIQVLLFQTLFLAVYDLFLKRETFFQWNRVYLMSTSVLAYIIPLIKINKVQEIIPQEYVVLLPEVVLNPTAVIEKQFDWWSVFYNGLTILFWLGIAFTTILFAFRLYKIIKLIYTHDRELASNYYLVWLKTNKAFSFFNYIFLGKESNNKSQIIEHELVHVKQYHSLDLLFFELQKIVFWFNPFSYIYQARISELHEYIADSKAIKTENKTTYFNNLLAETFGVQNISFINPFFKESLLKKRIIMLNKNKSKQLLKLKYVLLVPVLAGMLVYTSCEKSEAEITRDASVQELLNELNAKVENQGLTKEEKKSLMEIMYKTMKAEREKLDNEKEPGEIIEVPVSEVVLGEDVPFAAIENAPIFPDCENAEDPKKCLQESIQKHVARKFNVDLAKTLGLEPGKKKVYVVFKIDKEGNITDIKSRGPHADLEAEAIRVVNELPKMIPGEHQGKKVGVKYTLPITLLIE